MCFFQIFSGLRSVVVVYVGPAQWLIEDRWRAAYTEAIHQTTSLVGRVVQAERHHVHPQSARAAQESTHIGSETLPRTGSPFGTRV